MSSPAGLPSTGRSNGVGHRAAYSSRRPFLFRFTFHDSLNFRHWDAVADPIAACKYPAFSRSEAIRGRFRGSPVGARQLPKQSPLVLVPSRHLLLAVYPVTPDKSIYYQLMLDMPRDNWYYVGVGRIAYNEEAPPAYQLERGSSQRERTPMTTSSIAPVARPIPGTTATPASSSPWCQAAASRTSTTSRPRPPARAVASSSAAAAATLPSLSRSCAALATTTTRLTLSGLPLTRTPAGTVARRSCERSRERCARSHPARAALAGSPRRGLAVALRYRLRQAVETLPPAEGAALLAELRELVQTYAPRRPNPAA